MSNYYTLVSPESGLPCTKKEAKAIQKALEITDDEEVHGFAFEHSDDGKGYLNADESGCWSELPAKALALVGKLITKAGMPYLQMDVAFTSDRNDGIGGTAFRIMPDGSLVDRIETWPDSTRPTVELSADGDTLWVTIKVGKKIASINLQVHTYGPVVDATLAEAYAALRATKEAE